MKLLSNEKNHNRWRKGIRWNPILSYDVLLIRLSLRSRSSHKRSSIVSVNSISFYQERNVRLFLFIKKYLDSTITHFLRFTTFIHFVERTVYDQVARDLLPLDVAANWNFSLGKKKKKKEDFETLRAYVIRDQRIQRDVDFSLYILSVVSLFATPLPSIPYPTASTRNIKGKTGTRQELAINLIRSSLCVGSSTIIFTASTNSRL